MFSSSALELCNHTFVPALGPDSVVFDFGANGGAFSHAVIERFGCGVFAAEPVPSLFKTIAPHPNLALMPVAISGRNGAATLNMFDVRCASICGGIKGHEEANQIEVETVTLAEFTRRTGVDHVDLLKVDIEGAEIEMFGSASDDELTNIGQITVEFHDFMYPELRGPVESIKTRLALLGFWIVPFSLTNGDVLFINRRSGIGAARVLWLRTAVKYCRGMKRQLMRLSPGIQPVDGATQ